MNALFLGTKRGETLTFSLGRCRETAEEADELGFNVGSADPIWTFAFAVIVLRPAGGRLDSIKAHRPLAKCQGGSVEGRRPQRQQHERQHRHAGHESEAGRRQHLSLLYGHVASVGHNGTA